MSRESRSRLRCAERRLLSGCLVADRPIENREPPLPRYRDGVSVHPPFPVASCTAEEWAVEQIKRLYVEGWFDLSELESRLAEAIYV